jgi:hypothetical protein
MSVTELFVWAAVAHGVADFLLQSEWMALNKVKWHHPAAWIHAGIHFGAMLFVFPWPVALWIANAHFLIDLRFFLAWWRRFFGQTTEGPMAPHVAIWSDQVLHILTIAIAASLCGGR